MRNDAAELREALERPVVRALIGLIRFRKADPAFAGEWERIARLEVDLASASFALRFTSPDGERTVTEVAELSP